MTFSNNVKWVSLSQSIKVICQLLGILIFSRYLSTQQFGLMSITVVIVGFINILRDIGLTAAIIQRHEITEGFKSSVFYFNFLVGIFLFFLLYTIAPFLADFYNQLDLVTVLRVIAVAFPINSITSIHLSLLERDSRFFEIAKCESFSSILSIMTGVIIAYNGGGVYALVFQTLIYSFISGLGFIFFTKWIPKLTFSLNELLSTFKFSSNLVLFNFINYFSRNSDQMIIGKTFSASTLGQYSLAYRIMLFPLQNITYVLTRSLYPVLSRSQHDKPECLTLYLKTIKAIIFIVAPLMLGLVSVNRDFVNVIFGEKWSLVPDVIFWLAPTAILQSLVSTTGSVFMSQGKTNLLLKLTIFNSILQISSFVIGCFFGLINLVIFYLVANILMFIPNMAMSLRCFNGKLWQFLASVYKPLLLSFVMCVAVSLLNNILHFYMSSNVFILILSVLSGAIIYISLSIIFEREVFMSFYKRR